MRLCDNIRDYYSLLYSASMFVPMPEVARLRTICYEIGEDWLTMREAGVETSELIFKVSPKVHKIQHTPLFAELLNPAHTHAYAEESSIGTNVRVWQKSVAGRYKANVQSVVLSKRLLGVLLRYEI